MNQRIRECFDIIMKGKLTKKLLLAKLSWAVRIKIGTMTKRGLPPCLAYPLMRFSDSQEGGTVLIIKNFSRKTT